MTCSSTNNPTFPCRTCAKNVLDKDKAVQCVLCEYWIHTICNNLNYLDYRYLQIWNESWYCIWSYIKIFPFNSSSWDKNFLPCGINTDSSIIQWKGLKGAHKSSLLLKPTQKLELLARGWLYGDFHPGLKFHIGIQSSKKFQPGLNYNGFEKIENLEDLEG